MFVLLQKRILPARALIWVFVLCVISIALVSGHWVLANRALLAYQTLASPCVHYLSGWMSTANTFWQDAEKLESDF